ncbi:hypothetical protein ABW19_dt0208114 [Dactylella cylindrospora]|nr:hypothetical protein ABW19_dt0208114 [Dactylella cylindrospora]
MAIELSLHIKLRRIFGVLKFPKSLYAPGDNDRTWAEQVVSWYTKTWWDVLYRVQTVVTSKDKTAGPPPGYSGDKGLHSQKEADRWSWCHRIPLREADYTNINFFGFLVSFVIILSTYAFSSRVFLSSSITFINGLAKSLLVGKYWDLGGKLQYCRQLTGTIPELSNRFGRRMGAAGISPFSMDTIGNQINGPNGVIT